MKKIVALVMLCITHTILFAQTTPEGVNYQAVARNQRGEILANQPIELKVSLFSMLGGNAKSEYYSEVHRVSTSVTGVFSLIIGSGTTQSGVFNNIPWAVENVWMEVSIKSRGQG